ncbi:MAG: hypothetical protein QOJ16_4057, partial [Acidobacteriota bacterium]|nr:hypothetical protein [Acidobacteriota bacterium]
MGLRGTSLALASGRWHTLSAGNRVSMTRMPTLRLTQTDVGEDLHRVEIALEGEGLARQTAEVRFPFRFADDDQRGLRWYLEEYLQYPQEPHPKIAAGVEQRMAAIGAELFGAIFQGDARDLWAMLRERLEETRVEIVTGVREATSIPWELLRDPKTDVPLALRARSFVRALPNPAERPTLPKPRAGTPLRILLVICRPQGRDDVPFRSVSARILKSLTEEARAAFDLDLLRRRPSRHWGKPCAGRKTKASPTRSSTSTAMAASSTWSGSSPGSARKRRPRNAPSSPRSSSSTVSASRP